MKDSTIKINNSKSAQQVKNGMTNKNNFDNGDTFLLENLFTKVRNLNEENKFLVEEISEQLKKFEDLEKKLEKLYDENFTLKKLIEKGGLEISNKKNNLN